jgi:serine/threonine-protein kinase
MAAVYLARDLLLNRPVAIKVMAPGLLLGAAMVERFRQEAVTVANLQHAHIISIHAVRQVEDLHFFVMQFVPGRTIEGVLRERGALPIPVTLAWLYQVGSALAYAHRRGVIHRDVKPGNILLNIDGEAVVTDFGIAKVTENPALTQTGAVVGTPRYMSPEQCYAKELTGASDQYSLGIVAYEMLAGRPPFTGSSFSLMRAHTDDPPPPLRDIRPDMPATVEAALMRMLAKRPEDRFATLTDALVGLGAAPLAPADPIHATLQELADATERLDALRDVLRTPASPIPKTRERVNPRLATPQTTYPAVEQVTVAIEPPPGDLEPGATVSLHAEVKTVSGKRVEQPALVWECDDVHVASIERTTGLLTALDSGSAMVTAVVGTVRDSREIIVGPPRTARVEIVPPSAPVEVGQTVKLAAVVTNRFGTPVLDRPIAWSVEHLNVATIVRDASPSTAGSVVVRGISPGATVILASCDGALALAKVNVVAAPEPVAPPSPIPPVPEPAWSPGRGGLTPVQAGPPPKAPVTPERVERIERDSPPAFAPRSAARPPEPAAPPAPVATPAAKPTPPAEVPNATVVASAPVVEPTRRPGPPPPSVRDPGMAGAPAMPGFDAATSRRSVDVALPSPTFLPPEPPPAPSARTSAPLPPATRTRRTPWIWAAPVVLLALGVGGYVMTRGNSAGSASGDSTLASQPPVSAGGVTADSARVQPPAGSVVPAPPTPTVVEPPPSTVASTDPSTRPGSPAEKSSPGQPVARRVQLRASRTDAILPGQTVNVAATVRDESGKPIRNAPLRWSSSDPRVATVDATGTVLGIAEGSARISAQSGTVSEAVTVSVNAPPPDPAVVVTVEFAEIPSMTVGDSVRLNAVARNALGGAATGATIAWSSSNPDVAAVSANGVLAARGAGSTTIVASSGTRSAERRATVRAREVPVPPPPKAETAASPPPKSEADLRTEIRSVIARYNRGIESRDTALMRSVFPAAPGELLKNWQLTFEDARDGIQLRGADGEILDTPRDVVGNQVRVTGMRIAHFYSKRNRREMDVPARFTAVVQRAASGWRIVSIR